MVADVAQRMIQLLRSANWTSGPVRFVKKAKDLPPERVVESADDILLRVGPDVLRSLGEPLFARSLGVSLFLLPSASLSSLIRFNSSAY